MIKFFLPLVSLLVLPSLTFSQDNAAFQDSGHMSCAQHHVTQSHFDSNPGLEEDAERNRLDAIRAIEDGVVAVDRDADYIIPVVFHVVHANGVENISVDQINSAIEVLNEDFSANTPDIDDVQPAFLNIVGNVNVEYRLARKDPNGNCTNGINRVYSTQTFDGGENVKTGSASTWGRNKYLNIWVVNTIGGGAAGYAFLPWGGAPQSGDGIIIEHAYVGRVGTGNANRSHALSHEAGHWAGLLHTWGSSDTPTLPSNCNGDDSLDDTPNTIGWDNCDLDGESCGSLDNVENFMDYAYCYKMFTVDQADLMRYVLEEGPSSRPNLSSPTNLSNTGLLDPDVICFADFDVISNTVICPGDEVEFNDISYNGVTDWDWTFEGGSPASSIESNPVIIYNTPGVYSVSMTVSNANGSETLSKTNFITVLPTGENQAPFVESFESFDELEENHWMVGNSQSAAVEWELNEGVGYTGTNSVYLHGRINTNGEVETLYSPTYALQSFGDGDVDIDMTFKYAHARKTSQSDDKLLIKVSRNCGLSWSIRKTIDMDELPTVSANVSGEFVPESQADWTEVTINNIISSYLTDEFRIQFEFTSHRGNNIFIDDINVFAPSTVGLESVTFVNQLELYPNPANNAATLAYGLQKSGNVSIDILDLSGRIVSQVFSGTQSAGSQTMNIQLGDVAQGVYLVRIQSEGEQVVRRLVRQ